MLEERTLLSASPLDDFANTTAGAQPIDLPANEFFSLLGRVDYAGDVDTFRFTAPTTGADKSGGFSS